MARRREAATEEIRRRIVAVAGGPGPDLVAGYYARPEFAGALFDTFGDNPPDRFTPDDLVAASLLDVRFGPQAVRGLFADGDADALLATIPTDVPLWEADYDETLGKSSGAGRLWDFLTKLPGVGGTRASKLLARKRPALLPILDSVTRGALLLGDVDAWAALHNALLDPGTRAAVDLLGSTLDGPPPMTLRLLDVATWMRFSESDNARAVRRALGIPLARR